MLGREGTNVTRSRRGPEVGREKLLGGAEELAPPEDGGAADDATEESAEEDRRDEDAPPVEALCWDDAMTMADDDAATETEPPDDGPVEAEEGRPLDAGRLAEGGALAREVGGPEADALRVEEDGGGGRSVLDEGPAASKPPPPSAPPGVGRQAVAASRGMVRVRTAAQVVFRAMGVPSHGHRR